MHHSRTRRKFHRENDSEEEIRGDGFEAVFEGAEKIRGRVRKSAPPFPPRSLTDSERANSHQGIGFGRPRQARWQRLAWSKGGGRPTNEQDGGTHGGYSSAGASLKSSRDDWQVRSADTEGARKRGPGEARLRDVAFGEQETSPRHEGSLPGERREEAGRLVVEFSRI